MQLITGTFKQAFEKRDCPAGLIFHSDRGTQLYIQHFSKTIAFESGNAVVLQPRKADWQCSSRIFFALLKREELYRRNYRSEREFRESAKSYIRFYNAERPHRANRYKSPEQFEAEYSQSIDNLDKLVQNWFFFAVSHRLFTRFNFCCPNGGIKAKRRKAW